MYEFATLLAELAQWGVDTGNAIKGCVSALTVFAFIVVILLLFITLAIIRVANAIEDRNKIETQRNKLVLEMKEYYRRCNDTFYSNL